jgi:hypothetical protein
LSAALLVLVVVAVVLVLMLVLVLVVMLVLVAAMVEVFAMFRHWLSVLLGCWLVVVVSTVVCGIVCVFVEGVVLEGVLVWVMWIVGSFCAIVPVLVGLVAGVGVGHWLWQLGWWWLGLWGQFVYL